ncbi:o-succinylbenzoate synthase [Mycolicibacterium brumae]|uniref:o-succinylbenzoate synthase n=1 Tax=Mycolicibacterium brumae TaxID=85968 RepID=A0A2G5PE38_9MYCO|nr:o-succinylbenzoate synthase [Mycolicibacterium brumae]MCV7192680.1 o-succinylbenzoate synthase [Mycolicibacterium brumae]PIB76577.1 o-succinylbenzoate synthase [Mycolicibacterium brumae]UWW08806.1 o-succinylbenzoate synthase [Mycolicibacterium brumae]
MSSRIELRRVDIPLVRPFKTSRAVETAREVLIVRWTADGVDGWAECAADPYPAFYAETLDGARTVIAEVLAPLLAAHDGPISGAQAHGLLADVPGNVLARAALESAVLDAELRRRGMPMVDYLGGQRTRIPVGVSVGIPDSIDVLLDWVGGYLDEGYQRIKLKIAPGWDLEPVAAVRARFGDELALQVDANQAYRMSDLTTLRRLDEFNLVLLEQPFPARDLVSHANLADRIATPVCLDESINGLHDAATALALGACSVVNIKPARVGGYLEARAIHDLCLAQGIPVFCGGVLESGIGRAANLALAALPNFTLPGDISATKRYFDTDITQRFELDDGCVVVPPGAGSGAVVDLDALEAMTVQRLTVEL